MANTKVPNATRPNADEQRQPGQPKFQPVEQVDDEQIANEATSEERATEDDSNETSGGRQPGKRKGTRGTDSPAPTPQNSRQSSHSLR